MITQTKSPERLAEEKEEEQEENLHDGHNMSFIIPIAVYNKIVAIQRRTKRTISDLIRCWVRDGIYYFDGVERKGKRGKKYK